MFSIRRFVRHGSALAALALSLTIPVAATAADPISPGLSCEVDAFDAGLGAWSTAFLGDAAQGGATVVDGVLRVTSDGSELFHGDDSGLFVHRRIDGDFRVEIDVTGVPGDTGGTYRKGCLMVRGTLGADGGTGVRDPRLMACFVPHFPTPDVPAYQFDVRFGDGDEATELASAVTEMPVPTPGTPARFALTRLGDRVTVSYSADGGVTWIEPRGAAGGEVTIDLGDAVEAGVMVASYDPAQTATFDFDRFRACHLDGYPAVPEPTPAGEAPVCEAGKPYDIVYLLDLSESMTAAFSGAGGGAPETKLDAARTALERIHGQIGVRGDGSRAALLTFSGRTEEPDHNLANALDVRVPLTSDLASVDTEIRSLAPSGIPGRTTTPTALALQGTLDVLQGVADPARQTVLVLLTDGIPNVDDEGRGPDAYALREIQNIALTDADGAFLPWERIAWSGAYNGATDTFDGEPLGDAVRALDELAEGLDGLLVFGVGLRGDGEGLGTFKDELVQYAAHVTGGRSFAAADAPALITAADQILTDLDCGAPGTVSVGDRLWNDLDADGVEDAGEPGLAGVTIRVENAGGSTVATTVSDLSGGWLVRGLAAGSYTVRIDDATLPSGLSVPTHDLDGLDTPHAATLTLEAFEVRRDVDFGYRRGGSTDPTDPGTTSCTIDGFDGPDPDGWSLTAIGDATVGDMAIVDQRLHLTSNGPALWDDDRCHFVHRSVAGDFRVEVDVADLIDGPTGRSFRKGGLMIRGAADGSDDDAFD
ncbi:MAG: SdrD B-like domain-containing protein, partial [Acidobacteriota bacterium]